MFKPLKAWSNSRLNTYELCPLQAKLKFNDKIPEPARPLPPSGEYANDRGTRIHTAAEQYVKDPLDQELIPELKALQVEFEALRTMYRAGQVELEGEWCYNDRWEPVTWNSTDAWMRLKLDACVLVDKVAIVIDYKTGKRKFNEGKHLEQAQLYAAITFLRFPQVDKVITEWWYTDLDYVHRTSFNRNNGAVFLWRFEARGIRATTDTTFAPTPSVNSCRFCPYGPEGTKHCMVGIQTPKK